MIATSQESDSRFDPIGMEVFNNRLLSITEEMGNSLIRSSFSTNIKERRDCSVGLFDARGRLIAQASHIPLHLGSLIGGIEAVLGRTRPHDMRPGDAFICNDPYLAGGTHMPDIAVITPVFWNSRVRFFAANIGHHSDVGGAVPGSIAGGAKTIFEEGIRIPVIRIARSGAIDEDLLNLLVENTREPEERRLDIKVQIATNERGGAAVDELIRQMGLAAVEQAVEDVLAYTARRLRHHVRKLPDGRYGFTTWLDDDGSGSGDPVPIAVTVHVNGENLHFDFAGSGPQARGAMNVPASALRASVYYSVKALLDPELMPNSGMFDCVTIAAPEGSIVNPSYPAAVGARSITCQKIAGAIFGAFRALLSPEKAMASGNNSLPAVTFSGPWRNRPGTYVYLETIGGGSGARRDSDGMDAIHVHTTNTSNLPAEALEHEYMLLVEEYGLVADSGGSGRTRGGLGIARQIRALADGTIFSVRSDGHRMGADGVEGGGPGGTALLMRNPRSPDAEILHSKVAHVVLAACESMRLETPGGGGFGPPAERPLTALRDDLADGILSREKAVRDYGVERVEAALTQPTGDR